MRERVKRVDSIILKRFLLYNSVESVREKIVEVCSFLGVHGVVLEGLQKIGSTDLFRAVITDSGQRRDLLLRSHQLRHSPNFSRTYIHRDLTFQQRQDMLSKRRAFQTGDGNASNNVGSSERNDYSETHWW